MQEKLKLDLLRTSERQTFKRCPQKWWWAYVDRLRSRGRSAPALVFGDLMHQAMAAYYVPGRKRGPHPKRTFLKLYRKWTEEHGYELLLKGDDDRYEAGALGVDMCEGYVERYGDDPDIEIIAPEMPFLVEMKDAGGRPFYYIGRFDALGLWLPSGGYFPFEHKTGSEPRKNALQMDEQAGTYWSLAPTWIKMLRERGLLKKKVDVVDLEFILYNFMRKALRDPRPTNAEGFALNKNGSVSKVQPVPRFERIPVYRDPDDRKTLLRRVRNERYVMRLTKEGKLPVYKNPTDNCWWDCPFYDMCELHETRSDWKSFRDQQFDVGDPYEDYGDALKEVRRGTRRR